MDFDDTADFMPELRIYANPNPVWTMDQPEPWHRRLVFPLRTAWDSVKDTEFLDATVGELIDGTISLSGLRGPRCVFLELRYLYRVASGNDVTDLMERRAHQERRAIMRGEGPAIERLQKALEVGTRAWWLRQTVGCDSGSGPDFES